MNQLQKTWQEVSHKLKTDKKFLVLALGIIFAFFLFPYVTIPILLIWWFFK